MKLDAKSLGKLAATIQTAPSIDFLPPQGMVFRILPWARATGKAATEGQEVEFMRPHPYGAQVCAYADGRVFMLGIPKDVALQIIPLCGMPAFKDILSYDNGQDILVWSDSTRLHAVVMPEVKPLPPQVLASINVPVERPPCFGHYNNGDEICTKACALAEECAIRPK